MTEAATAWRPTSASLGLGDLFWTGVAGLRTRTIRALLSAAGIAIGIAAMVAVLGISSSSKADLIAQLDKLGTNLLTATPGQTLLGQAAELPGTAVGTIKLIEAVQGSSSVEAINGVSARLTPYISPLDTNGITVEATDTTLLASVAGTLASGRFLDAAASRYPAVVLGAQTAQLLGVADIRPGLRIYLDGHWFSILGILDPVALAPALDTAALIGYPIAKQLFRIDEHPTTVYVRTEPAGIDRVADLLPYAADPEHPEDVQVARPSDALAARAAAKTAFTSLFLGLGAVALLVGGIGIANIMVITVLERRWEVGLRRALGATRKHIAIQFLTESMLLAAVGGFAGSVLGVAASVAYALNRGWSVSVPAYAPVGGFAAAVAIGTLAGLYPAVRAARLAPTEALRTA